MLLIKKLKPYFAKYKNSLDKIHNLMLLDWLIALLLFVFISAITILLQFFYDWKLPFIKINSFALTIILYLIVTIDTIAISIFLIIKRYYLYCFLVNFDNNYLKSYQCMLKHLWINLKYKEYKELKNLIFDIDDSIKESILSVASDEKISLSESTALMWKQQNFYREPDRLHFISCDKKTKNNIFKIGEYKAIINKENLFVGQVKNNEIEIEYSKLIPSNYIEKVRGISIPNGYWQMSSSIFRLLQFINNDEVISDSVLYSILSDIGFILSKWKKWKISKLKNTFELFLISNMFSAFYDNSEHLKFSIRILDIYESTKLKNIFTALKNNSKFGLKSLYNFYEKVIKKVIFDKSVVDLSQSIKNTILGRDIMLNEYYSSTSLNAFDNDTMFFKFKDSNELRKYLNKVEPTRIYFESSKVFLNYLEPKSNETQIDIRYVLTKLINNYV
ncbi:hypothetical protein NPA07_01410 [Mycoplasmopsis caviae]|uniref:Uncharacterized protein n=1 Tax=Mycoplasmopsis caviae TaxID=55603 RepID=A0A3P8MF62_9BACT|nr:hypothetical protein [Mycoplasmopsis caviae]UUD35514.1 hypothetical protein NPA07_01410 [Mycoplasmopsis caviae]VDR41713.1 Uncharacterised protein [Mycoplasmopsis caviae]